MSEEKRRFSRVIFKVKAELTVDEQVYHVDEIHDLSVGGCYLDIKDESVRVGGDCTLKIVLNPADSTTDVKVEGSVVRAREEGVALKFTGITPESLEHLQNIIRYNAPDPDKIEDEIEQRPGLV